MKPIPRTLAKICSVIPLAVYGLLVLLLALAAQFPSYSEFEWSLPEALALLVFLYGWIPSLASAAAGVALSLLALKERHEKLFLVCSCVNVAAGVVWGWFALRMMLGSGWWQRL